MFIKVNKNKDGSKRYYLTRAFRNEEGKPRHEIVCNLTPYSPQLRKVVLDLFNNKSPDKLCNIDDVEKVQGISVGSIYTLYQVAKQLGIVKALGSTREGKLCLWIVLARLIYPKVSKLATVRLAKEHAVHEILKVKQFDENHIYHALDWVYNKQDSVEKKLYKHRFPDESPTLYLYDVTSSYFEGTENELAEFGYNRDKKQGKKQIVIGLLTDDSGWPISTEVFRGNTNDVSTFKNQIEALADKFNCKRITLVGDKGMIKSGQIEDLKKFGYHYITSITKVQIKTLMKQKGLQLELFTNELTEFNADGIRYVLRRNPVMAKKIRKNREEQIDKVKSLTREQNIYLKEHSRAKVDVALRKVKDKIFNYKLNSFLKPEVIERKIILNMNLSIFEEKNMLDGCYVIKTDLPEIYAKEIIHSRYKDLKYVEDDFRTLKTTCLEVRPHYLRNADRTRAHVFLCMLSLMITRHLKEKWKNLEMSVIECTNVLSKLCTIEYKIEDYKFNEVPEPSGTSKLLLNLLDMKMIKKLPMKKL